MGPLQGGLRYVCILGLGFGVWVPFKRGLYVLICMCMGCIRILGRWALFKGANICTDVKKGIHEGHVGIFGVICNSFRSGNQNGNYCRFRV